MVRVLRSDEEMIKFLGNALLQEGIHCPPHTGDKNYRYYQDRVRKHCLSLGCKEQEIENYFATVDKFHEITIPSEVDQGWFVNDIRASLWLACELFSELNEMKLGLGILEPLSPDSLQPNHSVRIQNIRKVIHAWPLNSTPAEYIKNKGVEWARLIEKDDMFSDFLSLDKKISSWLKKYLQNNISSSSEYICGEANDEIIAWCYTVYFKWKKKNSESPDTVSLFNLKFKSAWSTQKNRIKNKITKKLKPLNVHISEDTHRMLRMLALDECISNDKVVEHAIMAAYKNKRSKQ
ncbi:hypothetical protein ACQE32_17090 [Pantoea sp. FN0302]|uniref:hypothetical protein n=1 Tax=Pantoea sp. FN0302 TaxID=3418558 RepID=UPI003CE76760